MCCVRCAALPLPLAKYPSSHTPICAKLEILPLGLETPGAGGGGAPSMQNNCAGRCCWWRAAKGVAVAVRPKGLLLLRVCGSPKVAEGGLVVSGVGGAGGCSASGPQTEGRHGRREKRRREKER
ncbi:hypothetical protein B0H14DRAFT_2627019 [Mycena olivaceomarginata]|nr:hypothetical protein B0H14DRAFT_2627019 [Mycena olivaceomarginata]